MSTAPPFPPLEALYKTSRSLLGFHEALESYYFQQSQDNGRPSRPEELYVKKIVITKIRLDLNKSLEHERLYAYVARTCSPTGTKRTNIQYLAVFVRDNPTPPAEFGRWQTGSTEGLGEKFDYPCNLLDGPNRRYEMSAKFERDFQKTLPKYSSDTSPSIAFDPINGTASMKRNFDTNRAKSLGALADSVYNRAAPVRDWVHALKTVNESRFLSPSACIIHLADPPPLDTVDTNAAELSDSIQRHPRSDKNAPRKHLYFYEFVRLAALIHNRRACYRLFYEQHFWLGGMIAHVLRLFLEIDISVRTGQMPAYFPTDINDNDAAENNSGENDAGEGDAGGDDTGGIDFSTIGGKEDPGEDAVTKVFDDNDIHKDAWYSNTPRNAMLRKVMMKWLEDKEEFENKGPQVFPPKLLYLPCGTVRIPDNA